MIKYINSSKELHRFCYYLFSAHQKLLNPITNECSLLSYNNSSKMKFSTLQSTVFILKPDFRSLILSRQKSSNRRKYKSANDEDESSDESDNEDEESNIDGESLKGTEVKTYGLQTLRIDTVMKRILGYKRKRIEEAFYKKKIIVNNDILLKKAYKICTGDVIDLISKVAPENPKFIYVSRVEILQINEDPDSDNLLVKVQKTKSLLIENYSGRARWKQDEFEE